MTDQYVEPITTAATTAVTLSKIGTIGSAAIAGSAGYFGDHFFAWAGLFATVFFGALGTALSFYFKRKADKREAQSHQMMVLAHNATMARLTAK
jgi:hypothetical protein